MEEPMQEDWDLCEDSPQAKKKKYLMTLDVSLMSPPIPTTKLPQTTTFEKCQPSPGPESAYSSSYGKSPQVDNKWINTPNAMVGTPGQSSSGFETGTDSRGNTPMPKFNYECSPLRDARYDSTIVTLRRNYSIIKKDFMPEDTILDQCHEEDVIEDDYFEKIREASKKRSRASDLFVKALVEYLSKSSDESVRRREQKLSNIFERNGLKYFLRVTDAEKDNDALKSDIEFTGKELEAILDFNTDELMANLEPRNIIDQLLVAGMLSFDDHEDLLTTDCRRRRVEFLINHVKHDIGKNFPIFRKVLKDHRPHLEKKLMTTQKKSTQSQALSGLRMEFEGGSYTSTPSFGGGAYTIQMKLNFSSSEDVKGHRNGNSYCQQCSTNLSLDEEAMECCDAIIEGFSYSSIRIHLKPLSPVSARKLTEAIQTIHAVFNDG